MRGQALALISSLGTQLPVQHTLNQSVRTDELRATIALTDVYKVKPQTLEEERRSFQVYKPTAVFSHASIWSPPKTWSRQLPRTGDLTSARCNPGTPHKTNISYSLSSER